MGDFLVWKMTYRRMNKEVTAQHNHILIHEGSGSYEFKHISKQIKAAGISTLADANIMHMWEIDELNQENNSE